MTFLHVETYKLYHYMVNIIGTLLINNIHFIDSPSASVVRGYFTISNVAPIFKKGKSPG